MRTLAVIQRMDPQEVRSDFCALSGQSGALDAELHTLGSLIHYCRLNLMFPVRFSVLIRQHRYDVVHSHVHHFSGVILLLAAVNRVPVRIAHYRSTGDGHHATLRRKLQRTLTKRLINCFATRIVAVSESSMETAWSQEWRRDPRCEVIHSGIDLGIFRRCPPRNEVREALELSAHAPIVIHVGRIDQDKNQLRVIEIFADLLSLLPSAWLLLVGSGSREWEDRIKERIHVLGIAGRVRLLGTRADVPELLTAANLLLFPSKREGLPGVVLEACAAGIPTLGSDIAPILEVARQISCITTLSLNKSNTIWAQTASTILLNYNDEMRSLVVNQLKDSTFSLEAATAAHRSLWVVNRDQD
jgi:glycosyltransferase involved in cell wall biosynthesis